MNAISQVRLENGKTPPQIRQFFIDQLRYNDNTTNQVMHVVISELNSKKANDCFIVL